MEDGVLLNRAQRRALARDRVTRRDPITGRKSTGEQVRIGRSFYARALHGVAQELVEEARQPTKTWRDKVRSWLRPRDQKGSAA